MREGKISERDYIDGFDEIAKGIESGGHALTTSVGDLLFMGTDFLSNSEFRDKFNEVMEKAIDKKSLKKLLESTITNEDGSLNKEKTKEFFSQAIKKAITTSKHEETWVTWAAKHEKTILDLQNEGSDHALSYIIEKGL